MPSEATQRHNRQTSKQAKARNAMHVKKRIDLIDTQLIDLKARICVLERKTDSILEDKPFPKTHPQGT